MNNINEFFYSTAVFDAKGKLLTIPIVPLGTTDLIVVAHGWNNDRDAAESLYTRLFSNFANAIVGDTGFAKRRVTIVGILWPSKKLDDFIMSPSKVPRAAGADAPIHESSLHAAMRDAINRAGPVFDDSGDRERLDQLLALVPRLEDDSAAKGEFVEILRTLVEPTGSNTAAPYTEDGADVFHRAAPDSVFERASLVTDATPIKLHIDGSFDGTTDSQEGMAGVGNLFVGAVTGVGNLMNLTAYYKIKERANRIGRVGVAPLLDRLASEVARVHLIGHGFGGNIVTSAAKTSSSKRLFSLTLIRPALSQESFSKTRLKGSFRPVLEKNRLNGPLLVIYARTERTIEVPLAVASGLIYRGSSGIGDVDEQFGAISAAGIKHLEDEELFAPDDVLREVGEEYVFEAGKLHNIDATHAVAAPNIDAEDGIVGTPQLAWVLSRAILASALPLPGAESIGYVHVGALNVNVGALNSEAPAKSPRIDAEYKVFYATTRRPVDERDASLGYSNERDSRTHFGICTVFVPKSHRIGSTGSAWWKRLLSGDDRMRILAVDRLGETNFWASVTSHLASVPPSQRDAVVFVHGFNVDFKEAALRAAQLGFDMQVKGAMAFFSWASRGKLKMYLADAASVELDEDALEDYLCKFAIVTGASRVHVVAHSMGNRVVLRAIHRVVNRSEERTKVRFGQLILAAPDVDARKFQQLGRSFGSVAARTTLYVSSRDLAVEAASWLHNYPRAGLLPPVTIVDGIDTVNVVNADLSHLGHGYVAEARSVVSDMHTLINHNSPPASRFGLRATSTSDGKRYWLIGA